MLKSRGASVSAAIALGLVPLPAALALQLSASNAAPPLAEGPSPQLDGNIKLVCPNLVDISWDPSLFLTDTFGSEVCSVD